MVLRQEFLINVTRKGLLAEYKETRQRIMVNYKSIPFSGYLLTSLNNVRQGLQPVIFLLLLMQFSLINFRMRLITQGEISMTIWGFVLFPTLEVQKNRRLCIN